MRASMRCFERARRVGASGAKAALAGLLLALAAALLAPNAHAHKASDAYLLLTRDGDALALRWDIALRDLDAALDLDADGDRQLRWGELRPRLAEIRDFALGRLVLQEGRCALAESAAPALERRSDGGYLVLSLRADCPAAPMLRIDYRLLGGLDPTHRGLLRFETAQGAPPQVRSLDPTAGTVALPWDPASAARSAGAADNAIAASGAGAVGRAGAAGIAGADATAAPSSFAGFFRDGVHHILIGYDHVLFLVCLLLPAVLRRAPAGWQPVARARDAVLPMVGVVTLFTLAHSITLALAGLGIVTLSPRLIEPAIALTIAVAALDCLVPVLGGRRALFAFGFGLIHGFGFAAVLAELALPAGSLVGALLAFNLGVEAGQLVIVAAVLTLLLALRGWRRYPAVVLRGGSALALAMACVWFVERVFDWKLVPV